MHFLKQIIYTVSTRLRYTARQVVSVNSTEYVTLVMHYTRVLFRMQPLCIAQVFPHQNSGSCALTSDDSTQYNLFGHNPSMNYYIMRSDMLTAALAHIHQNVQHAAQRNAISPTNLFDIPDPTNSNSHIPHLISVDVQSWVFAYNNTSYAVSNCAQVSFTSKPHDPVRPVSSQRFVCLFWRGQTFGRKAMCCGCVDAGRSRWETPYSSR